MTQNIEAIQVTPLNIFSGVNAPEAKPIPWIMPGFLARGAGTILFGQPGVSKTIHAAILAAHLWQGASFAGLPVLERRLRVLYVDLDGGWDWNSQFFRAAFRGVGLEGLPGELFYYSPLTPENYDTDATTGQSKEPGLVGLEEQGQRIAATVKAFGVDVVIVDSLGQYMSGDMNASQDVSIALRLGLNPARAQGAAVLVIDHATKAARGPGQSVPTPAGSQQKRAWARVTVALEEEEVDGNRCTRWSVDKSNAAHFAPFLTRLHFQNDFEMQLEKLTLELLGDAGERGQPDDKIGGAFAARQSILSALEDSPKRRKDLGKKNGTFDRVIDEMLGSGEIRRDESGVYQLTAKAAPPHQPLGNGGAVQLAPTVSTTPAPLRTTEQEARQEQLLIVAPNRTTPEAVSYDLD